MNSRDSIFCILTLSVLLGMYACRNAKEMTPQGQAGPSGGKRAALASLLETSEVFSSNLTGFALYDPEGDSMIFAQNEDRYFTPASNTKLFTFYTGLKLLPDSLRALEYVVRGDSLIFWGTGDPSFLHPEFGNEKVYEFLKNREEKLYFSDSNFNDRLLGPGWAWGDYHYYYQTEKSPLPMYGNTVRFEIQEIALKKMVSTKQGRSVSPPFFRSYIKKMPDRGADSSLLFREMAGNRFEYKPKADTSVYTVHKPYHYTPELITGMLSDTLHKKVTYLEHRKKPDSTRALYSIASDTAYKRMLQPSDNFIAEQLLLVTASELGLPLDSEAVIEKMTSEYLAVLPHKPQWVDGSGLSRYNLFTPRSMIRLLVEIDEEFASDRNLFHLLPAGGKRGTIRDWYAARNGGPAYVFAKTGTLSNNHCLSGYMITKSGRKLLFSFMNNHYVTSSSVVKKEMEKVLWYIRQHY